MMMARAILWPSFALVALIFLVGITLLQARIGHMRRQRPRAADLADTDATRAYFRPVERPAANLANLFEMPVLYFALVPLLILTTQATRTQAVLAWLFVLARATHSYIHIVPKKVPARFFAYLISVALLLAMWIGFFVDLSAAARGYYRAMDAMQAAGGVK